jgi:hypothetical protein
MRYYIEKEITPGNNVTNDSQYEKVFFFNSL